MARSVEPAVVAALAVGADKRVTLRFTPPESVTPGKYEVRIRTTSFADDKPIEAELKTITVEVRPELSLAAPVLLGALMIGVILLVVVFGVRLSRR